MLAATDHFSPPFIVMDPIVAREFEKLGFDKQGLEQWCIANAKMKRRDYWDDQWTTTLIKPAAMAGIEPTLSMWNAPDDQDIQIFQPGSIKIVVAGGETQGAFKLISGRLASGRRPGAKGDPPNLIDLWR
jgi:hypothetical protein